MDGFRRLHENDSVEFEIENLAEDRYKASQVKKIKKQGDDHCVQ